MSAAVLFWFGVAWIAYVYAGYPVLLGLISLVKHVKPASSDDYEPFVSVLIAARNEEKDIRWKIEEIFAWNYPAEKLEVLVASDASEDATDSILASISDSRLSWMRMEPRGGKVKALNELAKMVRGEVLFFTDANAHIEANCVRRMVRHFADRRVGCVTGDSSAIENQASIGSGAGAYWNYEKMIKAAESRMGAVLVCDGAIFCLRRDLFAPCRPELANDLEIPIVTARRGCWILHEPEAKVFERDTTSIGEEFQRRRRMSAQGALAMWLLRDSLRGMRLWEFVSHKLLRWLTIVPVAMILASAIALSHERFYEGILAVQLLFYSAAVAGLGHALLGKPTVRLFSVPFYVLLGTTGAFIGTLEAVIGRRFAVWEISVLSRGAEKTS